MTFLWRYVCIFQVYFKVVYLLISKIYLPHLLALISFICFVSVNSFSVIFLLLLLLLFCFLFEIYKHFLHFVFHNNIVSCGSTVDTLSHKCFPRKYFLKQLRSAGIISVTVRNTLTYIAVNLIIVIFKFYEISSSFLLIIPHTTYGEGIVS